MFVLGLFYVVLSCVCTGLATSWSLVQRVLPYVVKYDYETELTEARAHWGCRITPLRVLISKSSYSYWLPWQWLVMPNTDGINELYLRTSGSTLLHFHHAGDITNYAGCKNIYRRAVRDPQTVIPASPTKNRIFLYPVTQACVSQPGVRNLFVRDLRAGWIPLAYLFFIFCCTAADL
jgi:hypothetical protein